MTITIHHRTLGGRGIVLVVTLDADGAVMFWRSEDQGGAHVELSNPDKWFAVLAMKRAAERMARGAA